MLSVSYSVASESFPAAILNLYYSQNVSLLITILNFKILSYSVHGLILFSKSLVLCFSTFTAGLIVVRLCGYCLIETKDYTDQVRFSTQLPVCLAIGFISENGSTMKNE